VPGNGYRFFISGGRTLSDQYLPDDYGYDEWERDPQAYFEWVRERVVVIADTTLWRITLYKNDYGELKTTRTRLVPSCWDGSDIPF
jgi:hypothetical protein